MGYKANKSKSDMLEANRDYIIEEFIGIHSDARSARSLAIEFGVHRRTMDRKLAKWRKDGLLEYRGNGRLDGDRKNIESLYLDGMPITHIAQKFNCSRNTVKDALRRWGKYNEYGVSTAHGLPKMSLNDLKTCWSDILDDTIITVGRIPKFRLIPIGKED